VSVSYRDLTRRAASEHWPVELLVTNCSRYISNWAYVAFLPFPRKPVTVALTVAEQRTIDISLTVAGVSQCRDCLLRCLGDACDVTAACSSPPVERGDTGRTTLPLPRSEALSGQLTRNALLRNPTMGWHVTIQRNLDRNAMWAAPLEGQSEHRNGLMRQWQWRGKAVEGDEAVV
jgi:hypothetical protein